VADRGYQFVVFEEVPDNFERSLIPSKHRGCLPSGNEQEVVSVSIDYLKGFEESTSYPCLRLILPPRSDATSASTPARHLISKRMIYADV